MCVAPSALATVRMEQGEHDREEGEGRASGFLAV